jgi:hypothetical protein
MTTTERTPTATGVVYDLEGTLLEACSCLAVCPCWVGQDPDGGSCDAVNAYRFERGTIRGVDVSGLSFINVVHIPGNVLVPGSWQVVSFVDDRASDAQFEAILDAYHGRLGGPLADLAGLVGEVRAVERTRSSTRSARAAAACASVRSCRRRWSRSAAPTAPSRPCGTRCSPPSPARPPTWPRPPTTAWTCPGTGWCGPSRAATPSSPTTASATPPSHDRRHPPAPPAAGRGADRHRPGLGGRRGRPRHRRRRPLPPRRPVRRRRPLPGRGGRLRAVLDGDGLGHDAALGRAAAAAVRRDLGRPRAAGPAAGLLRRRLPGRVADVRVGGAHLRRRRPPDRRRAGLVGRAALAGRVGQPGAGRGLPVLDPQGPLPHRVPAPGRLPAAPLPARPPGRLPPGLGPRAVLPGLLLGADAGHVLRRRPWPG